MFHVCVRCAGVFLRIQVLLSVGLKQKFAAINVEAVSAVNIEYDCLCTDFASILRSLQFREYPQVKRTGVDPCRNGQDYGIRNPIVMAEEIRALIWGATAVKDGRVCNG